jgi:DNA-binding NarL/FixJ family response regulator
MIQLFVVDDHPIIIDGIRSLTLPRINGIEIIGSSLNVHEAISNPNINNADIIILDLYIPNSFPLDNVRSLRNKFHSKKIIIFTIETSCIWIKKMFNEGVNAYLFKDISESEFLLTITKVHNGEIIFPLDIHYAHDDSFYKITKPEFSGILSSIQLRIIKSLCNGLTIKQIAEIEGINSFSVDYQLKKVRKQFNVKNNVELIAELVKDNN